MDGYFWCLAPGQEKDKREASRRASPLVPFDFTHERMLGYLSRSDPGAWRKTERLEVLASPDVQYRHEHAGGRMAAVVYFSPYHFVQARLLLRDGSELYWEAEFDYEGKMPGMPRFMTIEEK